MKVFTKQIKACLAINQNGMKLNITKAAKNIGMSKGTLSDILNGRNMTMKNLKKIMSYLGCVVSTNCKGELICLKAPRKIA